MTRFNIHQLRSDHHQVFDGHIPRFFARRFNQPDLRMVKFLRTGRFSLGLVTRNGHFVEIWALLLDASGAPYIAEGDIEEMRLRLAPTPADHAAMLKLLGDDERAEASSVAEEDGEVGRIYEQLRSRAGIRADHNGFGKTFADFHHAYRSH